MLIKALIKLGMILINIVYLCQYLSTAYDVVNMDNSTSSLVATAIAGIMVFVVTGVNIIVLKEPWEE